MRIRRLDGAVDGAVVTDGAGDEGGVPLAGRGVVSGDAAAAVGRSDRGVGAASAHAASVIAADQARKPRRDTAAGLCSERASGTAATSAFVGWSRSIGSPGSVAPGYDRA